MKFQIAPEVHERFSPIIGVIYAHGIDNSLHVPDIDSLFAKANEKVRAEFAAYENPQQHPNIAAWRLAFKAFGANPKDDRCSVEALVRRILRGDTLPRISTLVDLYNYVSVMHVLPVGGEDLAMIEGDLRLALAAGTEHFMRLGGSENEPPFPGEVIYADDAGAVCRRWNWREADRTQLRETTTDAVIVIDAISPTTREELSAALAELEALITLHCGGTCEREILA